MTSPTVYDWNIPQTRNELNIYWPRQLYDDQSHFSRTKSCSPPNYITPFLTTHKHPRVKSASARLSHSEHTHSLNNDKLSSDEKKFLFNIILNAPTALTKKYDKQPITYLNRGQSYLLDFQPTTNLGTVTSTISLAFHEPNHREIAENYWKYWLSQHEDYIDVRALDLDVYQSTGVSNVRLVSFDRIAFDWHSRLGAKVCVRFNCLSTDFSRIKGVKGIPLRVSVDTTQSFTESNDSLIGTFQKSNDDELFEYKESCYCKIKLFRDKGAERKNKDDKKQKQKQIDKLTAATNGNPENHPLWPTVNQESKPFSSLDQIPALPDMTIEETDKLEDVYLSPPLPKRKRSNTSDTAPLTKRKKLLTIYAWNRHSESNPKEILLERYTAHHLKSKLAVFLSIHPSKISEIVWRRKQNDILVLVDDTFILGHLSEGEVMTVDWELKQDTNLRVILEF